MQSLEICDGSSVDYGTGIDGSTLENFDLFGWTWEYNFWNDDCANYTDDRQWMDYNISGNQGDFEWSTACDSRIQNTVMFRRLV